MTRFTRIGADRLHSRKRLLVFISTGDTCRAPMAAGYFQKLLDERGASNVEVRNAGIMTVPGLKATPEAIQVLDTVDVDLRRYSSHKLSNELIKRADLILGMSSFHVQTALRQSPSAKGKTFLLKEYVGSQQKNVQISDPMGGTLEVYKRCFQEIMKCCDQLLGTDFIKTALQARKEARSSAAASPARETPPGTAEESVEAKEPKPGSAKKKTGGKGESGKKTSEKKGTEKKAASRKSSAGKPKKSDKKTAAKPASKKAAEKKPIGKKPAAKKTAGSGKGGASKASSRKSASRSKGK